MITYQQELLIVADLIHEKIPMERRPSIWDICKDIEGIVDIVMEGENEK